MALTKVIGRGLGVQGDTVAGDDAALGFTSTEGLILTGQGSTGDVTIKNDADALVAFVPTGTDDLRFPDNAQLQLGAGGNDLALYHNGSNNFIYGNNAHNLQMYTAGNLALKIDTTGAVTKPLQPAFFVAAQAQNNISTGSDVAIQFVTEVFDQNSDFDTSNYTFTAPVTGRYHLTVQGYLKDVDTSANYIQVAIRIPNRSLYWLIQPNLSADATYFPLTISTLVHMDANDTAVVKYNQGTGASQTDIDTGLYYSGYLVC